MKIVIIGDGKVGHKLANKLDNQEYDIVLIDQNKGKLRDALNQMDISCINGNGMDADVQKQAGVQNADLVIACTSTDEINMLSCLLAKRIGAKHTIARVRSPLYYKQIDYFKEDLMLSMTVNPELAAANDISEILLFPEANKVESFMKGRVKLVEHRVNEESPIAGLSLADVYKKLQTKILVCAVRRGKDVFIPDGSFVLQSGDYVHIAAAHQDMKNFFSFVTGKKTKIHKVMICGGGHLGFYLATQLLQAGMQVKIVEEREAQCELLCDALPKATIICGNSANHALLMEEGIDKADAVVALTGMDEENIMLGLYAKMCNVKKAIAKVNDEFRRSMVEKMDLDCTISVKEATADVILSYVKARMNSFENDNIETIYYLVDERVQAQEYIIKKECKYTGTPLKDLRIKKNNLIACIGRKRKIIIPGGNDCLEVGDSVIVITKDNSLNELKDILA